ncbi:general substrate transporter [Dichotomocladium elegans]|nr:general substrate transporter [Dichotomocladium elegans]
MGSNDETSTLFPARIQEPEQLTGYVYILVFCTCMGGFLFGYDTGVISGALQPLEDDFTMTITEKELVVGGTTFGAIFGGLLAGMCVVSAASIIFIIGAGLLTFAGGYTVLMIGRIVVGLGVGIASMIVPLSTVNTLMVTFGQVVAYIVNILFANVPHGWRYMFALAAFPAIAQLLPFIPESPRRLIAMGETDQVSVVLRNIYGKSVSDAFIEREIRAIETDIKQENDTVPFRELLLDSENYQPLAIACLLQAAQQLSGFNTAMYYAATIMQMAGFRDHSDSTSAAIIVAMTNMAFTAVAIKIIDRVGRRRMLIFTMFTMALGLLLLGGSFAALQGFMPRQETCDLYGSNCARPTGCPAQPSDRWISGSLLVSLFIYVASYALGLGYAPWLIQSELFSTRARGKGNGIATAVNWTCNLVVASTFLSLANGLSTAITFWGYAVISLFFWVLVVQMVPETSGKSLEEVHASFRQ